ncbi:hypothetical protein [Lentibacillus saliphilus]|uniref:hypothetical protein n=1 Tax=Lentibacillus saliphilus TaxID=2737028 RepID=UPI001FE565A3|nr:hypothetical protein [Lentibacillus saliphilus]
MGNCKKGGNLIKFLNTVDFIYIFAFTLLLVYDYFPFIPLADAIPKGVLIALILGLIVFSLIFKKYRGTDKKELLKWHVFWMIYILFLMGLLTLLGGTSSAGIAFNNGIVWFALLISMFEMYSQWKKVKKAEA